jgi:arylsulfatase A-like enzyme/Flp pilus assembly protein TadD
MIVVMKRKGLLSFLFLFGFSLGALAPASALGFAAKENAQGWNVLLVTVDTLRADRLSCYGEAFLQTPSTDSLSRRGILFSRAFSHNPTTLASHTNMLLGLTPLGHGVRENTNFVVREKFFTLAEFLKKSGYATGAFIGGYPLHSRFGLSQGFDVYDDDYEKMKFMKFSAGERKAGDVIDRAMKWLEGQDSSWFCWIHCFDPHDPYDPPEPFKTQYAESPYDGEVAYVDRELGRFLKYMEEKGLFDKTLVVFTGDHGESLGQHGEMTHGYLANNTTIWVPLIISYPGAKPGRVNQCVGLIDIFPTICDILQVEKPGALQGISLLPAMKGRELPDRPIYFESLYPYYSRGWAPIKGFIQKGEKYIQSPIPELYDLEKDFDETHNLAGGRRLDAYRKRLNEIIEWYSYPDSEEARQRIDRKSLEKLRSLGYISSPLAARKESYGPEDDVKTLLPFHNKSVRAWELYLEGHIEEGFDLVKQVITERQDVDIAYTNLAKMYSEQGRLKEALQVLELALEHLPDNYGVILTYVSFLNLAGRYDDVIDILNAKKVPQMENDPEIWNYLGLAYSARGEYEQAIAALETALTLDDEFAFAYRGLANTYLSRFFKAKDKEDLMTSIRNFEKALELEPEFAAAYNSLGVAYKENSQTDDAIRCWEKAFELRPDVGFPLLNLGLIYMEREERIKALDYLKKYKDGFYSSLAPEDRKKLDALIQRCERKSWNT